MSEELIITKQITKSFSKRRGGNLLVLDHINFSLKNKEFVCILGKSGSGKSTFLRIIAGLIPPTTGELFYRNKQVLQPVPGIAMVFQSFALMPWLTVLENVELGLEALGYNKKQRRNAALKAIDTIGLDGFESAYPKELSGGMRQRVGFARALVVEPEILLMDEPFSALDILTAENLRNDLLDLWQSNNTKIKSILCVTHDIEEAILMADRIVIFDNDPGRIKANIPINIAHPRNYDSDDCKKLLDTIYSALTTSERERIAQAKLTAKLTLSEKDELSYRIPEVDIAELTGLLESMVDHVRLGKLSLPEVAEDMHLDVNNLFPLTEVLDLLRFANINSGEISVSDMGFRFAEADILERKNIFAHQLLTHIPLAKHIREVLDKTPQHRIEENVFLGELKEHFSEDEATRILKTIIDWGRYAEIFAYDYDASELSLENPQ